MSRAGIVLRQECTGARLRAGAMYVASTRAAAMGLGFVVEEGWTLRFSRTIFVATSVPIPWDLLRAGLALLERWDVAVPFSREHELAQDLGTETERQATRATLFDLRIPVYDPGILLARDSEAARAFLTAWRSECCASPAGVDERLAFLRAAARVKPLLYVLPRAWFYDAADRKRADAGAGRVAVR